MIRKHCLSLPAIIILTVMFMSFSFCYAETPFNVTRIGNIVTYGKNYFKVKAPESGFLTISVHDDICVYRTMEWRVEQGESKISWDGCGYNREKLYPKIYTITCSLEGLSGTVYTKSFNSPVSFTEQSLQYVLPSSDTLYLDAPEEWFLEFRTVMDGNVIIEFNPEGKNTERNSCAFSTDGGKINRKTFKSFKINGSLQPGQYTVTVYEASKPHESTVFTLLVNEITPEKTAVTVTGEIMPDRSMSEQEIWEIMMKPSVVIDIDFFDHQHVYDLPDSSGRSLGTLHGQTQCLKVIRIQEDWALIGAWNHEEAEYIEGWVPLSKLKVTEPQKDYGILIDKQKQTLSLFYRGTVLDTLFVSTGRPDEKRLYQETSAGSFLTGYHRVNFSTNGKKYDFVFQYDGGNLLHQTPYQWGHNKKDFTLGRGYLGAKASHACIRIQADPGESGINAYWLWTHIPYHTRVVILDDPVERRGMIQQLQKEKAPLSPLSQNQLVSELGYEPDDVSFTFGGNYTPGAGLSFHQRKNSFLSFVGKEGTDKPFSGLQAFFAQDDFTCISLCSPMEKEENTLGSISGISYAPASLTQIFGDSSVEGVQLSDQSVYDNKQALVEMTEEAAGKQALVISRQKPVTVLIKGHLFGMASCSEQEYLKNPDIIDLLIEELKEKQCERIIMLISWGEEKGEHHSIVQEAIARRCVLAGADLVVGSHPHSLQGMEQMMGVPVIYSMGNLLDGSTWRKPKKQYGILVRVVFHFDQTETSPDITVIPIKPYGTNSSRNDYIPSANLSRKEACDQFDIIRNDSFAYSIENTLFYLANQ